MGDVGRVEGAAEDRDGPALPGAHARPARRPPTFAIADVGAREIVLTVFSERAEEVKQERASFSAQGKMSVR